MYSATAPLSSQSSDPQYLQSQQVPGQPVVSSTAINGNSLYAQPIAASGQQVPQYSQPQDAGSNEDLCTTICTSKAVKFIVTFAVFVISPLLMGVVGILGPFFLITKKVSNMFAPFLFAIYTLFAR